MINSVLVINIGVNNGVIQVLSNLSLPLTIINVVRQGTLKNVKILEIFYEEI